jgi:hypothetical protein
MNITIISSIHPKSLDKNPTISKAIKNADLILVEGVSHNSLLTWENFKREPLIITFMLLYYLLLRLSSTFGKNDIDSIRLLLRREGKKFYKDWFFCDASGKDLIDYFYRSWHMPLQSALFLIYAIILYFLIGVSATFVGYVIVIPIFLPGLTFVVITMRYRNDFPIHEVIKLSKKGTNKILILYGKNHIKDLKEKLNKLGIKAEII